MAEATLEDLRRLLRWLDPDPQTAWEIYFTTREKLVTFFRECPSPIDRADEALDRIARRENLNEIRDFRAFAYGVAKKMRSEIPKEPDGETGINELPGGGPPSGGDSEDDIIYSIDRQRKIACFCRCLKELAPDQRRLFLAYKLADSLNRVSVRGQLAVENVCSRETLAVRVSLIRRELQTCARKCLANPEKRASGNAGF